VIVFLQVFAVPGTTASLVSIVITVAMEIIVSAAVAGFVAVVITVVGAYMVCCLVVIYDVRFPIASSATFTFTLPLGFAHPLSAYDIFGPEVVAVY